MPFALIGLAIQAVGVVKQNKAAKEQQAYNKQAEAAQTESNSIQKADSTIKNAAARRRAARDTRIKKAQLTQGAVNQGSSGSSGELGALSGFQAALSGNIALQEQDIKTKEALSGQNQKIADAQSGINESKYSAARSSAFNQLLLQGVGLAKKAASGNDIPTEF